MKKNTIKLPLGKLAKFKSGGTPSKSNKDYWGGDLPWVSAKDLKSPEVVDSIDHLSPTGFAAAKIAPAGSLLILVRGMTLHKDVPVCMAGRDVAFNQDIKALIVSEKISSKYLLYFLHSRKNKLLELVDSAGHGTGRLNTDSLKAFPVLVPPISEQIAIADLLSTWEEAIEKTEWLIQAKERQYRHLVWRLIHQQRSLSEVKLGDIATPITTKNAVGEANVLTSSAEHGLISQLEYYNKSVSADDVSGYYLLERGDFAYNRSSATGYPYGAIKRLDRYERGVLSTLYICFRLTDTLKADSNYLTDLFEAGILNRQLRGICQAGARSHGLLNVTKSDFFSVKIPLPSIERQREIAEKLDLARSEIALLKELSEKHQTQKRGLMQKLLTGQWRVRLPQSNIKQRELSPC